MTPKSRRPELTTAAKQDLRQLSEFVQQCNEGAAQRLIEDLVERLHHIAHIAHIGVIGSTRPFLPDGVRAFPYRNWCFYFTVDNGTLSVLRVLRGEQDTTDISFAPDDTTH